MKDILSVLKQYWGYEKFRPLQADIITAVLEGRDCLALLPTGGGKSLCFQVPALAQEGLCLVISPLIALMKDQVENLRRKNITAFSIHSGLNRREVKQTLEVASGSNCKLLYVSPERLGTALFREYLPSLNVRLIAVDEAHCISQWGYDFRPSYLRIAELREELPDVPVLALTASATPEVQTDICEKLLFTLPAIFRQSFERPALSYSVFREPSKMMKITEVLNKVPGTAIVYCKSRKKTREISELLCMNGIAADHYHAGLTQDERNGKQEAWINNRTRVIVCTNAFGMGIDKPDVRTVIHADVPDCLENYYQEAGRAGRDGRKSYAVLLYTGKDVDDLRNSVNGRFPGIERIRFIYKSLMNHLQIPASAGEGNYYEFDVMTFTKTFKLDMQEVMSTLKTLEQEELVYFNEQVFLPSKVQVVANRESLRHIEETDPRLDALIKVLLRNYEGIFDQETGITERLISTILKIGIDEVADSLVRLNAMGAVIYIPQKDKPQIYLPVNRVRAEDLKVDGERYRKRKERFVSRVGKMIEYLETNDSCRSVLIGRYFGDEHIRNCGVCDNCIKQKKQEVLRDEFDSIRKTVEEVIQGGPVTLKEILAKVNGYPRHKTAEVIRYLQTEEKIRMTDKGFIEMT